ncbi:MAG: hypothetical protein HQL24_09135 [Candidatus Omnitrophica bacterium]|nr:hypothetical protein [Candidatus Omnitrophota bacterium]
MNTHKRTIIYYTLAGFLALAIGLYVRLFPLLSSSSEDSSEKATLVVLAKLKYAAILQINRLYPTAPQEQKDILSKQLFDELIKKDAKKLQDAIDQMKINIHTTSNPKTETPYLLEADSFNYYDLTNNIIKTGALGPEVKGSKFLSPLMLAPRGHWEPFSLHPYMGLFVYKILSLFNPHISLMHAVSFTPLVTVTLSLIPFLLICFLFEIQPMVAFASSMFYLLSPIFLKRSFYGWFDNDPYNTLFPLLTLCFFFYSLLNIKHLKKAITFSLLAALSVMLYSYFWQGWMFLLCILIASLVGLILFAFFVLKDSRSAKNLSVALGVFFAATFIAISFAFGIKDFFALFSEGWSALKNFLTPQLAGWPDLYISVGELHKASLKMLIELTGGYLFFSIALLAVIFFFIKLVSCFKTRAITTSNIFLEMTLVIFLMTAFVLSSGALRFALLCLIPLSILFPLGLQKIITKIQNFLVQKFPNKNQLAFKLILMALLVLIAYAPAYSLKSSIKSLVTTIYNDTWNTTMLALKEKTPKDSIVTAWWPPGHFIRSMAERRVTFDGATINVPQAYWVSNFFLSTNEHEALGILRMLDDSGNEAAEYLQGLGLPLSTSVFILKEITSLDRASAYTKLQTIIKDDSKIDHLLSLTHRRPPPAYCLIYNEFVEGNIQLSFLGNWNFKAVEEINQSPERLSQIPKKNSQEYIDFLWKLVGGMPKYSGILPQISHRGNTLIFDGNVQVDLDTMTSAIASSKYGRGIPYSIFYANGDDVIEKTFDNWKLPYSLVLFKDSGKYSAILMDRKIAQSLLIRLYFFEGKGLKHFKLFTKESDLTGRTKILTFQINWEEYGKAAQ